MAYNYRRKVSPTCRVFIQKHTRKHIREGMDRDQAVAASYSEARKRGCKVPARSARRHPEGMHDKGGCCDCGADHCCCMHTE